MWKPNFAIALEPQCVHNSRTYSRNIAWSVWTDLNNSCNSWRQLEEGVEPMVGPWNGAATALVRPNFEPRESELQEHPTHFLQQNWIIFNRLGGLLWTLGESLSETWWVQLVQYRYPADMANPMPTTAIRNKQNETWISACTWNWNYKDYYRFW